MAQERAPWACSSRRTSIGAAPCGYSVTTPLLPSAVSHGQPRSGSTAEPLENRPRRPDSQLRFTRICPPAPRPLVSETDGALLVSVTLLMLTPPPDGGGELGR